MSAARVVRASEAQVEAASHAYREVWTEAPAPGGFICSICGGPVESEPCPEHAPATESAAHWLTCPCAACQPERKRRAGTYRPVSAREGCEERLTRFEEVLAEHRITGPSGWGRYGCEATDCDFDTEDWTAWEEHVAPHLMAVADAVVAAGPDADEVTRLRAELALYKRGGKTLGETIDWQCRAVLDATGLHHLIDEDGDGDWALVWEHLAELRPRAEAAKAERDRLAEVVARVEALAAHLNTLAPGDRHYAARLRAALSGPTHAETPQNGPESALSREQGTSGQSGEGEALRGAEKGEEAGR